MPFDLTFTEIVLFLSLAGTWIGIYLTYKKQKTDIKKTYVEISEKYQEMLTKEIDRNKELETTMDKLKAKIRGLECEVQELYELLDELTNGIKQLIEQIKSKGETPIWTPKSKKDD